MILRIVLLEVRENLEKIQQMIFVIKAGICVKPLQSSLLDVKL